MYQLFAITIISLKIRSYNIKISQGTYPTRFSIRFSRRKSFPVLRSPSFRPPSRKSSTDKEGTWLSRRERSTIQNEGWTTMHGSRAYFEGSSRPLHSRPRWRPFRFSPAIFLQVSTDLDASSWGNGLRSCRTRATRDFRAASVDGSCWLPATQSRLN